MFWNATPVRGMLVRATVSQLQLIRQTGLNLFQFTILLEPFALVNNKLFLAG
jgi:hypothetical protein